MTKYIFEIFYFEMGSEIKSLLFQSLNFIFLRNKVICSIAIRYSIIFIYVVSLRYRNQDILINNIGTIYINCNFY